MWWHTDTHFVWMMAFWVIMAVAVVFGLRYAFVGPWRPSKRSETPEQILKRRFASGEIDRDEYQARLRTLHHDDAAGGSEDDELLSS